MPPLRAELLMIGTELLLGQIQPQHFGAAGVDVIDLSSGHIHICMEHHTNDPWKRTCDVNFAGTEQRHIIEPNASCGSGWEGRHQIWCRSEHSADQVVGDKSVSLHYQRNQLGH